MTDLQSNALKAIFGFGLAFLPVTLFAEEVAERKFFFNAYVTQAYGETDGGQVLGLDEDGTFNYRNAAALLRYQWTARDKFVLQLSHEKIGASPLGSTRDDVEIDWAFYEHRFNTGYGVRVGRVPIPFGIYNEIRDVGTLLEFYRPPVSIYFEGAFSSESVDGVVISKEFFADSAWSLGVDLYAGKWDRAEFLVPAIYDGEAENARGIQLWLHTPVQGLRAGLAYQRFNQKDGATFLRTPDTDQFEIYLLSVDADFEKFVFHAEGQWIETAFSFVPKVEIPAYYGLAGWRFTETFEAYVMYENSYSTWKFGGGIPDFKIGPQYRDRAISMLYRFNPKILMRIEAHHYQTTSGDVPLRPGQQAVKTDFGIISLTWSF